MTFDIDGDIRVLVKDGRQFAEGFFALWVNDGASGGEEEVFLEADVYLSILYDTDNSLELKPTKRQSFSF